MKNRILLIAGVALAMAGSSSAYAGMLDLTNPGLVDSGFLNGGFFKWTDIKATGTGNINTFVQLGDATPNGEVIEGYNTTVNNTFDNKSSDQHNHQIALSSVPIVKIGGIDYREFLLDINEPVNEGGNNPNSGLLSLDEIQIFLSNQDTPNQSVESFSGGILEISGDLIFRLDTNTIDNYILLDAGLQPGSGKGDMFAYIPESLFLTSNKEYLYLYSRFGENYVNDGGFEEWARRNPDSIDEFGNPVPEPATMLLFASGLFGAGLHRRRRS